MQKVKKFEITSFDVKPGRVYSLDIPKTFEIELTEKTNMSAEIRNTAVLVKNFMSVDCYTGERGPNRNSVFDIESQIKDYDSSKNMGTFILYHKDYIENGETWKEGVYVVKITGNIITGKLVHFLHGFIRDEGTFTSKRRINPNSHFMLRGIGNEKIYYTETGEGQKRYYHTYDTSQM